MTQEGSQPPGVGRVEAAFGRFQGESVAVSMAPEVEDGETVPVLLEHVQHLVKGYVGAHLDLA